QLGAEIDPEYRKIGYWSDYIKKYQVHKYKEFSDAFKNSKEEPLGLFPNEKQLDAKEFFSIFPIDIDACENNARVFLGMGGKSPKKSKSSKLDSMANLSSQQFEIKIAKLLKENKYSIVETLDKSPGQDFNYIVKDKKSKKYYCSAYQSTSKIGELELQNLLSECKNHSLPHSIAINVGGFSKEARDFAENYAITIIDTAS
ncbi:restriction endonuclease, partial [bacterium]|nr:restriction endonuclease [bacterium]